MSAPPIPTRRRKPQPLHDYDEEDGHYQHHQNQGYYQHQDGGMQMSNVHHGLKSLSVKGQRSHDGHGSGHNHNLIKNLLEDAPETTIGKNVKMKGDMTFDRLLRVDGEFEGKLHSKGDLIIGKHGSIKGDLIDMGVIHCEGKILGNITVERLEIRGKASIFGNITCKSMKLDPSATVVGQVNVNPFAPSIINEKGEIVGEKDSSKSNEEKKTSDSTESESSSNKQEGDSGSGDYNA